METYGAPAPVVADAVGAGAAGAASGCGVGAAAGAAGLATRVALGATVAAAQFPLGQYHKTYQVPRHSLAIDPNFGNILLYADYIYLVLNPIDSIIKCLHIDISVYSIYQILTSS